MWYFIKESMFVCVCRIPSSGWGVKLFAHKFITCATIFKFFNSKNNELKFSFVR